MTTDSTLLSQRDPRSADSGLRPVRAIVVPARRGMTVEEDRAVTAPEHDAKWWRQFTVAPPPLQKAMYASMQAREILEIRTHLAADDDPSLAAYVRLLEERERNERRIRESLGLDQLLRPASGQPDATPDPTANRLSPATSDIDRYW